MKKRLIETVVFGFGFVAILGVSFVVAQPNSLPLWEDMLLQRINSKVEGVAVRDIELTDVTPIRLILRSKTNAPLIAIYGPGRNQVQNLVVRHAPIFALSDRQETAKYQVVDFTPSRAGLYKITDIFQRDCPAEPVALQISKIRLPMASFRAPDGQLFKVAPTRQTMAQDPTYNFGQDVAVTLPFRHAGQITACHGTGVLNSVPSIIWTAFFKADVGQFINAEMSGDPGTELAVFGPGTQSEDFSQVVEGNKKTVRFFATVEGYYSVLVLVKSSELRRGPVAYDLSIEARRPAIRPDNRTPKCVPRRPLKQ